MKFERAAGILGVLIAARLLTLGRTRVEIDAWTPVAYLWQDVATAIVFAALDYVVRREWFGWLLYGAAAGYIAINVPIARILSSPLTFTMMRAAGGPLADSIRYYLTPASAGAITVVICAAIVLPVGLSRWKPQRAGTCALLAASLAVVAGGPHAVSKVDTAGKYRNAFGALWPTRVSDRVLQEEQDWRASPFPVPAVSSDELAKYRGGAAGRNVVMVLLESTAARYWPVPSLDMDPMPNLTALAAHSISFQHAYAVYPESIKGLFSVLCSRYPGFDVPAGAYAGVACPSLAEQLAKTGYRTALFHSGRFMYLGMPAVIEKRGFEILEDAGAIGGNVQSSFGVDDLSTVHRALSWIDSLKPGEKFFITYLPVAGHHPYATPRPGPFAASGAGDEFTRYRNALHYGDQALGELFDGLRKRGLESNTLFLLFGDHGEAFGQHDGNYGHTMFIYDENVHVPYIIAAPGLIQDRPQISRAVSLLDTAPTILDLLGLPIPSEFDGTSMLDPRPRMSLFFTDYSLGWLGLHDGCRKFLFEINSRHSQLYDVCMDPDETHDLTPHEMFRIAPYRSRLEGWITAERSRILEIHEHEKTPSSTGEIAQ